MPRALLDVTSPNGSQVLLPPSTGYVERGSHAAPPPTPFNSPRVLWVSPLDRAGEQQRPASAPAEDSGRINASCFTRGSAARLSPPPNPTLPPPPPYSSRWEFTCVERQNPVPRWWRELARILQLEGSTELSFQSHCFDVPAKHRTVRRVRAWLLAHGPGISDHEPPPSNDGAPWGLVQSSSSINDTFEERSARGSRGMARLLRAGRRRH